MTVKDDVSSLTHLGQAGTKYPERVEPGLIETFPNRFPGRVYPITFETEEFTSLCPMTGQPGVHAHRRAVFPGIGGVAPEAAQVAAGEAHEGAGPARVGRFALDGTENFGDVE